MIAEPPVCVDCKHYLRKGRCRAFPERIPDEIWYRRHLHTESFPGDHGIRFEPIEEPFKAKTGRIPSRRR
jgi:hypothetical protein